MKLNHNGSGRFEALSLVSVSILLIIFVIFAFWALAGRQKYKNDDAQLISTAVASATEKQKNTDQQAFAAEEQNPLTEYIGPQAYGTINLWYPKNWSSYINTSSSNGGDPLDGYFDPGSLPSVTDNGSTNFALRVQIEGQSYASTVQSFTSQNSGGSSVVNITAYSPPKLPSVVGVEVSGQLSSDITGTMVILPLRANALEVWTEGSAYLSQFNQYILPNLSFSP